MPFKKGSVPWNRGRLDPRCAPTLTPTVKDIYWAAGIYEGEGYCGGSYGTDWHYTGQSKAYRCPTARVTQKDRWILDKLRSLFGGTIKIIRIKRATAPEKREYFVWDTWGSRALGFLQTVYILLSPRRQEQIRRILNEFRVPESQELENAAI